METKRIGIIFILNSLDPYDVREFLSKQTKATIGMEEIQDLFSTLADVASTTVIDKTF